MSFLLSENAYVGLVFLYNLIDSISGNVSFVSRLLYGDKFLCDCTLASALFCIFVRQWKKV